MSTDTNPAAPALTRLAERYGISSHFENAYGSTIAVSAETMSLLLSSMGVNVTSQTEAQDALDRLERHDVRDPLPATVVVVPKNNWCLIQVNDRNLPSPLDWRVELESGEELSGHFHWQEGNYYGSDGNVGLTIENLPLGYHRLHLPQMNAATHLLVCPEQCWLPDKVEGGYWGIAVQLYLMRSATNWGIGDFSDLKALVEVAGEHGCGLIGLNPLHQMFLDNPEAASPYSPATRLCLNPLYIDVLAVPEWPASPAAQALVNAPAFKAQLEECRASSLVNYSGVTELKLAALRLIYQSFSGVAPPDRHAAFAAFCRQKGDSLERASLFQVLRQHYARTDVQADWRRWPAELQTAGSQAQREFAEDYRTEIDFQNWLQFIADEQLETAAKAAREQGMAVGLYRDLAVGCDASGAETWANPAAFLQRNLVGAPPDIFSPAGQ
ncbi:MAG: 4-alpha-glucanotransferase, partial [Devosia sp.]